MALGKLLKNAPVKSVGIGAAYENSIPGLAGRGFSRVARGGLVGMILGSRGLPGNGVNTC